MKLSDFKLLDEDEDKDVLDALVHGFNQTASPYPKITVHAAFVEQAVRTPDSIAVASDQTRLTYRELDEQSNRVANLLLHQGIQRESIVGVMMDSTVETVVALLGILKAGGAYCPINPETPAERIRYMLTDAGSQFLIFEKKYIRRANRLQWECPSLRTVFCIDSECIHAEPEEAGEMMKEDTWDFLRRDVFDDISGGGWRSSYTGEWLSREVMDEYGRNIELKLRPLIQSSTRILEIGCASGISMFRLAPHCGFYYGTDLSARILKWTTREVEKRNLTNIRLKHLAAHELDRLDESRFDVVIVNSVAQCFGGHNYFRAMIRRALAKMNERGVIFLGNLWDQDLKDEFIQSLQAFDRDNRDKGYRTKTDRSEELFLSRQFLEDLRHDFPEIESIETSLMLGNAESELSKFGYDAILRVNKHAAAPVSARHKQQLDNRALMAENVTAGGERADVHGLAYLMYTSGTTGTPKGSMIEHQSILRLVKNTNYIELTADDRILQTGSLAFDASTLEIWGAVLNGARLYLTHRESLLSAPELGKLISRHEISTIWLTASLFNQLVDEDVSIFKGLRTLLVGGDKLSAPHIDKMRRAHPSIALINGYGPTENTTFTTCHRIGAEAGDIPIGKPISNTTVYILDGHLQPVPAGVPGELCTGGDGLSRGYLNDPVLTAAKFIPHPFIKGERIYRTGDLCRWRADGVVEFMGRMDNQVKIRGFRIEPSEIESRLRECEGVREAIVLGKDFGNGNELAAWYTTDTEVDSADLRHTLKSKLPDYMIPAYFTRLTKFPLNANGKVDRKSLPHPVLSEKTQAPVARPENELEKMLLAIWEEVLGRRGIGVTDNFFDLGGHSLKVTKLVPLIQKRIGIEVPLTIVFKLQTIRSQALYLNDARELNLKDAESEIVLLNKGGGPRIFAFPPGSGYCLGYSQAATALNEYSFYGFNFIESNDRLQQYAERIAEIDPRGPYVLLGYSAGGKLAFQAACELENRGRSVAAIIMIDSARYLKPVIFKEESILRAAQEFLQNVGSSVVRETALQRIKSYYSFLTNCVEAETVKADIHLIKSVEADDTLLDDTGTVLASMDKWSELTRGKFIAHRGSGTHRELLSPPHLSETAVLLRAILSKLPLAFNSGTNPT